MTGRHAGDEPAPARGPGRRWVAGVCLAVGVAVAAWAMLAIPARATYGARTTADEPQYLLSALSLAEDRDLWIDDELAEHRYQPFHEVALPVQTEPLDNGRAVSPHDPLLPVLLAVPMGLGGWAAAKAALAVLAGALAALLIWTAHRRLAVPLGVAAGTVLAFGLAAPLSAYATQVYPELPAALAVTVVIAGLLALTGPDAPPVPSPPHLGPSRRWWLVAALVGIVSLPWLGVKYAPVAAVLALLLLGGLWRSGRGRVALGTAAALAVAGVAYLVGHRLLYGGWTVYAAGDHFVEGELSVVGTQPNHLGRSRRLVGLLLDRQFGLAAWMPGYLLAVPALAALLRRSRASRASRVVAVTIVAPLAAGWATATWVALTMHGWWWPGRQTVVVLPCLVLVVAWWLGQARRPQQRDDAASGHDPAGGARGRWPVPGLPGRTAVAVAGAFGAVTWLWLVAEARAERLTLIVDFQTTGNPLFRAWRQVLPDYRHPDAGDWALQAAWLVALGLVALAAAVGVPGDRRGSRHRDGAPGPAGPAASGGPIDPDSPDRRRPTHVPA